MSSVHSNEQNAVHADASMTGPSGFKINLTQTGGDGTFQTESIDNCNSITSSPLMQERPKQNFILLNKHKTQSRKNSPKKVALVQPYQSLDKIPVESHVLRNDLYLLPEMQLK